MTPSAISLSSKEALLQRWQRHFHGRTHISFQELIYSLRQRQLLETLFCLFDRDSSALLSESEWLGSIYKITEMSNRTKDVRSLETFLHRFQQMSHNQSALTITDFCKLFEESSVSFASAEETDARAIVRLVPTGIRPAVPRRVESVDRDGIPRHSPRRLQVRFTRLFVLLVHRRSSSVKSDTKWLAWIAYQFHTAVNKQHRTNVPNNPHSDETMDLETFKNSFYFKVVRITRFETSERRRDFLA